MFEVMGLRAKRNPIFVSYGGGQGWSKSLGALAW
jgi:hypothetical protein